MPAYDPAIAAALGDKTCSSCKESKPRDLEQYPRDSTRPYGLHAYCFPCRRLSKSVSDALRHRRYADRLNAERADRARRNPERWRDKARRRTALEKSATVFEWAERDRRASGMEGPVNCFYCGEPTYLPGGVRTQPDHLLPLSRGGHHGIGNRVPSCHQCNSSKGAKTLMEWLLHMLRLGVPAPRGGVLATRLGALRERIVVEEAGRLRYLSSDRGA